MKKITFTILLACLFIQVQSQSPRVVLLEHFTQASCGPCATYNPAIQTLLNNNPTKMCAIKYQTSWPGVDPMNAQNPSEVASRVSLYGVSGVPNSVIDGNYYNGHPSSVNQTMVNTRSAVTSPFDIHLSYKISDNLDSVYVRMGVVCTQAVSGNKVAHIAVIERHIHFTSPPGSNGETDFYNVMKKMLPNANGTALPTSFNVGDSVVINQAWSFANVYKLTEIAVVGFVQNTTSKEVDQAAYVAPYLPYSIAMNVGKKKCKIGAAGSSSSYMLTFNTTSTISESYRFKLNKSQLPAGWSSSFVISGTTYTDSTDITVAAGGSTAVTVNIVSNSTPNTKGVVAINVSKAGITVGQELTLLTDVTTLLVDRDGSNTSLLRTALTNTSNVFLEITSAQFGSLDTAGFNKTNLDHLIINTGAKNSATLFSDSEIAALTHYLVTKGNLFVSGQDVGYSAYSLGGSLNFKNFYKNYLGATFKTNGDTTAFDVVPFWSDPVFNVMSYATLSGNLFPRSSDHVIAFGMNSHAAMYYSPDNTDIAVLRSESAGWKTVYCAFAFELLNDATFQSTLLDRSIEWFDGLVGIEDQTTSQTSNVFCAPNPASGSTVLHYPISNENRTVVVYDLLGNVVFNSQIPENSTQTEIQLDGMKNGIYLCCLLNADGSKGFFKLSVN